MTVPTMPAGIPDYPRTLTTKAAKDMWLSLWTAKASQIQKDQDVFFITMICETQQDILRMKRQIKQDGDLILINDDKTTILNPLHKQVTDMVRQQTQWLSALGFSPKDRTALLVELPKKEQSGFDKMRELVLKGEV